MKKKKMTKPYKSLIEAYRDLDINDEGLGRHLEGDKDFGASGAQIHIGDLREAIEAEIEILKSKLHSDYEDGDNYDRGILTGLSRALNIADDLRNK